ncbi:MAG TPA: imidazoleglycerol-phosphate dehydratase HisB [Clostridiales bacterium]|nr:imidazoleglycerol-phosphate dehydratase HisB [Clostridiales bacterium]
MRKAHITRKTTETDIDLRLTLDGTGVYDNHTGCGFLDHMLDLFARHGHFDLTVSCQGDSHVDYHHTTEDVGIALGEALVKALGDKKGIVRYGSMLLPMDEALVLCAVDLSGRGLLVFDVPIPTAKVGDFDTEILKEFMLAFARSAQITLHFRLLSGENSHHILEACFKALGRALAMAVEKNERFANEIPSTKGTL